MIAAHRQLRTGECSGDCVALGREHGFAEVEDLALVKRAGTELGALPDTARFETALPRLEAALEAAFGASTLPESVPNERALSDFLVEIRRRFF